MAPQKPKGEVHIIEYRCKGCGFCMEFCPKQVLEASDRFNDKGYHPPKVRLEAECIACGLCQLICPEFAIYVERVVPQVAQEVEAHADDPDPGS